MHSHNISRIQCPTFSHHKQHLTHTHTQSQTTFSIRYTNDNNDNNKITNPFEPIPNNNTHNSLQSRNIKRAHRSHTHRPHPPPTPTDIRDNNHPVRRRENAPPDGARRVGARSVGARRRVAVYVDDVPAHSKPERNRGPVRWYRTSGGEGRARLRRHDLVVRVRQGVVR